MVSGPAKLLTMARSADFWNGSLDFLHSLKHLPGAMANAGLLESVRNDWQERVIARTSMHDLLFTLPEQGFPWAVDVRVSAVGDEFEFSLHRQGKVVTADRCIAANGRTVLQAFLEELVAED